MKYEDIKSLAIMLLTGFILLAIFNSCDKRPLAGDTTFVSSVDCAQFSRGDINIDTLTTNDDLVILADAFYTGLNHPCPKVLDVDGDGHFIRLNDLDALAFLLEAMK